MHGADVGHMDIKPANVLVAVAKRPSTSQQEEEEELLKLKLCDFSLARKRGDRKRPCKDGDVELATLNYRPPDLLLGNQSVDPAIDLWSLGCVVYEVCAGRKLFPGRQKAEVIKKILTTLGAPTHEEEQWLQSFSIPLWNTSWPRPLRELETIMNRCRDPSWLPMVQGLLQLRPEKRLLVAQGAFVNCAQDASCTRDLHAACFAAPGQLCPSLAAPIVVDMEAATDGPVLLKNPATGLPLFRGERAEFAVLFGRLPQPLRQYINQAAFLRKPASELASMGLQTWDEDEMKKTGGM